MRFSLHQQNCKPNSTAGRHKAGGINPAGASHPQLPKAQYARGPEIHHTAPVLCMWKGLSLTSQRSRCGREHRTHCVTPQPLWAGTHWGHRAEQAPAQLCPTLPHANSTPQGGKGGHWAALQPTARGWTASSKSSLSKGNWGGLTDKVLLRSQQMSSRSTENQLVLPY